MKNSCGFSKAALSIEARSCKVAATGSMDPIYFTLLWERNCNVNRMENRVCAVSEVMGKFQQG